MIYRCCVLVFVNICKYVFMYISDGVHGGVSISKAKLTAVDNRVLVNIFDEAFVSQFFYEF